MKTPIVHNSTVAGMVWLDKHPVSVPDELVFCPLRDRDVGLEQCLVCQWLVQVQPNDAPHFVVCDPYAITGWLGFTEAPRSPPRARTSRRAPGERVEGVTRR